MPSSVFRMLYQRKAILMYIVGTGLSFAAWLDYPRSAPLVSFQAALEIQEPTRIS